MNFVFSKAKEGFDENTKKGLGPQVAALKDLHKDVDLDQETLSLIKKRQSDLFSAPDFLEVYSRYQNLYKEFNDLLGQI